MKAEKLIYTLHNTPPKANAEGVGNTLCDMKAEALIDTLAETPLQGNAQAFGDTMGNVKAKKSTGTLITYREGRNKLRHTTRFESRGFGPHAALNCTRCKYKKSFDTLGDVNAEALMDTLADTLAEAEAETPGDTPGHVKAEALV